MSQDYEINNDGGLFGANRNRGVVMGSPLFTPQANGVNPLLAQQVGQQNANIDAVLSGIGEIQHPEGNDTDGNLSEIASTTEREQELRRELAGRMAREAELEAQLSPPNGSAAPLKLDEILKNQQEIFKNQEETKKNLDEILKMSDS